MNDEGAMINSGKGKERDIAAAATHLQSQYGLT